MKDIYHWHNIENYIKDEFLDKFIELYWRIESFENLKIEIDNRKHNNTLLEKNQIILDAVNQSNYDFFKQDSILDYLKEKDINIDILKTKLILFLTLKESLGTQGKILNDLKNRQIELLRIQTEHKNIINLTDGECPTCGFDWESSDNLLNHIHTTELKIFEEYNISNVEFEKLKEEINFILASITEKITRDNELLLEATNQLITFDSFSHLESILLLMKEKIEKFFSFIDEEDRTSIISLVNNRILQNDINIIKDNIRAILDKRKPSLDSSINTGQLIKDFDVYFQNNAELLYELSIEDIYNKSLYITAQYYLAVNKSLGDLNQKIQKLNSYKSKIDNIREVFDTAIKDYTKNIVDTVTIPFYIYTGKILQRHSLGSGLVLDLDIKKTEPQLKINPSGRDQEVSYTLSSG